MLDQGNNTELPAIPAKRYFTIGEVGELCGVKPHVLRYWEQEFPALNPVKRRGNRRYYQRHDVLMIRQIRSLLYDEGFTITGAADGSEHLASDRAPGAHGTGRSADPSASLKASGRAAQAGRLVSLPNSRGVAQPGSASAWGAEGRRFKSGRPDQFGNRNA